VTQSEVSHKCSV